jgi:hypothetical protein
VLGVISFTCHGAPMFVPAVPELKVSLKIVDANPSLLITTSPVVSAREKIHRIVAFFISQVLPEVWSRDLLTLPYNSEILANLNYVAIDYIQYIQYGQSLNAN